MKLTIEIYPDSAYIAWDGENVTNEQKLDYLNRLKKIVPKLINKVRRQEKP